MKKTRTPNDDGPETDYEITFTIACDALGLPLRDMYLAEHPELTEGADE